jgi:hypothetical protein
VSRPAPERAPRPLALRACPAILLAMELTPREDLPYTEADVAEAETQLRTICAALPEVTERISHGSVTFLIRGKRTLAYLTDDHHGDGRLAVICAAPPGAQDELIEAEPDRFFRPPYVGHRGWVGLRVDVDPDWDEVRALIGQAYRLVAPVTLVRQLEAGAATADPA